MRFNHGYTADDEKFIANGYPAKLSSAPEYNAYDHLYETNLDSGLEFQQTPTSGRLEMHPNQEYSHLIHGDVLNNGQPAVPNRSFVIPSESQWEIPRERLNLQGTIGRGEFALVKKGFALNVDKNGGWVPVAVKTLSENG